ncbi:unnamed protein product [Adineta ricciae]|uniref:Uncharacterized protein n=1 Tax=Adineta ricciae TaxID=249248 RepID=A0A813Q0Q1_ADIRI|nr:unnamed protein product [Adineta ricciae]CAF1254646.1 unnamed protein product [Adineta ricciae]
MSAEQALKNSHVIAGIMLICQGLALVMLPQLTTKLLLLSPLETAQAVQYVRTTGLAVVVIGYYYCVAGKCGLISFFRASIIGRLTLLPVLLAMIHFFSVETPLIILGIQDLMTAMWSYACLKAYDKEQSKLKQ